VGFQGSFLFLPHVDDLGLRVVLGIEAEGGIREVGLAEIGDADGGPSLVGAHLHLCGLIGLGDEDVEFLDGAPLVLRHHVYLVFSRHGLGREGEARLVDVDELIGVHGLLLGFGRGADVHLVVFLMESPLRLAVVPYGGGGGIGAELVAFNGDSARGVAVFAFHLELGRGSTFMADDGGRLVEDLTCLCGVLCSCRKGEEQ